MMGWFWLRVMRLAYRRLASSYDHPPPGVPGMRDPDAPCPGYSPSGFGTKLHMLPSGGCESDGHYLCGECIHHENRDHYQQVEWSQLSDDPRLAQALAGDKGRSQ